MIEKETAIARALTITLVLFLISSFSFFIFDGPNQLGSADPRVVYDGNYTSTIHWDFQNPANYSTVNVDLSNQQASLTYANHSWVQTTQSDFLNGTLDNTESTMDGKITLSSLTGNSVVNGGFQTGDNWTFQPSPGGDITSQWHTGQYAWMYHNNPANPDYHQISRVGTDVTGDGSTVPGPVAFDDAIRWNDSTSYRADAGEYLLVNGFDVSALSGAIQSVELWAEYRVQPTKYEGQTSLMCMDSGGIFRRTDIIPMDGDGQTNDTVKSYDITHFYQSWSIPTIASLQVRFDNADTAPFAYVEIDRIWLEIYIKPIDEAAYVHQIVKRESKVGYEDTTYGDFLAGRDKTDVDISSDQGNVTLASTGSRQTVIYDQAVINKDSYIAAGPNSKTNYGISQTLELSSEIEKRILIELDLSSIPASVWVESAYLWLQMSVSTGLDKDVSFYRITAPWNEFSVTWEDPWMTFGGDYDPSPIATTEIKYSLGEDVLVGWNITDAVRDWGAGNHYLKYQNYGMLGIMENITLPDNKHFHSSDTANVTHFPKLEVTFSDLSYTNSGTFESTIFDAGCSVTWDTISWTESTTPGTTSLKVQTRTGSLPDPDFNPEAWTNWSPTSGYTNPSGDAIVSPAGRYLQYRLELSTNHQNHTPVLSDILVRWSDTKLSLDYSLDNLVNVDVATLKVLVDGKEVWSLSSGTGGWSSTEVDIGKVLFDNGNHLLSLGLSVWADNPGTTRASGRFDNVDIFSSPYGEYFSPVWGSTAMMDWQDISWIESVPIGANVEIRTRTGNFSFPDASWSPWSPPYTVSSGEPIVSPSSNYIQYSLTLSTLNRLLIPKVEEVSIGHRSYEGWGAVESNTFSPPGVIAWGIFNALATEPPGSDIRYYYSTNDGASWFEMFPGSNMSSVAIPNIKVKAELTTLANASTPLLDEMTLTYIHLEPLERIEMSLTTWIGTADDVVDLDATGWDKHGKAVTFQQYWSTSDPNGTVDGNGLYNPGKVGTWRVYCNNSDNTISNYTTVTISVGQMVKVGITPWQVGTISTDDNITFNAYGFDADANMISQAIVNWSLTSFIGVIEPGPSHSAFFNPTTPGSARVIADDGRGNINVTSIINVVPGAPIDVAVSPYDPGTITTDADILFTAYGTDYDGNTVGSVSVNWSVMGGIGSVPPGQSSSALFNPTSVGNGKISIDDGQGHTNSTATFSVEAGEVASIMITPSWTEVEPDGEKTFTASGRDADGNQATLVTTIWTTTVGNIVQATATSATLQAQSTEGIGWVNASHGTATGSADVSIVEGLLSPVIQGTIPHQSRPEDYGSWSLDLTGFATDPNENKTELMWNLKNSDSSLYTVSGVNIVGNHILVFSTVQDAYGDNLATLELINSQGYTDSQPIWINITSVNDPPMFSGAPDLYLRYDEPYTFDYAPYITDIDSSLSDFSLTTDDLTNTTVSGLNVTFNYPESMVGQTAYVRITAMDGSGGSDSDLIAIRVSSNYPPTLVRLLPDVEIFEGETKEDVFDLDDYIVDPDADSLFFSFGYTHITIVIDTDHNVTITAEDQWTGVENVTFRAVDPIGGIVEDTIKVTVYGVNDPPEISGVPPFVIRYEYPFTFDLTPYISDVDNDLDELVITTSNPNNVTVDGHKITLVYPEYWFGTHYEYSVPLTIFVSDGSESSFQVVTVTVNENYPPEVMTPLPDLTFYEDFQLEYAFDLDDYFSDRNNDTLFYVSGQKILVVTIFQNHTVTVEAPADWFGLELVTFRAIDIRGAIVEDSIKVEVLPVNDPPVVLRIPNQVVDHRQWTFDLTPYISDVDDDISVLNITTNSQYVHEESMMLFFDFPEGVNSANITIRVCDGKSNTTQYISVIIVADETEDWISENWPWLLVLVVGLVSSLAYGGYSLFRNPLIVEDLFLIHKNGMLIEHHTRRLKITVDHDILSGMLTAILEFTRETFAYGEEGGLKKMDLGERTILLAGGKFVTLALVVRGEDPEDMSEGMNRLISDIEERYPEIERWDGTVGAFKGLPDMLGAFVKGNYEKGFWKSGQKRIRTLLDERQKNNSNHKTQKKKADPKKKN